MAKELENPKCQDLLSVAKTLFWKHGIKRVSVKEICTTAGVSKMTFYRFFDNKIDLAKTLLDQIYEKGINDYEELMAKDIPYAEKVELMLLAKFRGTQDISQEFLEDIHANQITELIEYFNKMIHERMQRVLDDFKEAQERGDIRKDIKLEFILYLIHKMREMAVDPALTQLYDSPQEMIMEINRFFFYGILENKN